MYQMRKKEIIIKNNLGCEALFEVEQIKEGTLSPKIEQEKWIKTERKVLKKDQEMKFKVEYIGGNSYFLVKFYEYDSKKGKEDEVER